MKVFDKEQEYSQKSASWTQISIENVKTSVFHSIEMQEDANDWRQIATVDDSLAYTIKNLKIGFKYRFRVRAKNIHGAGDPSPPSDIVTFGEQREDRNKGE